MHGETTELAGKTSFLKHTYPTLSISLMVIEFCIKTFCVHMRKANRCFDKGFPILALNDMTMLI